MVNIMASGVAKDFYTCFLCNGSIHPGQLMTWTSYGDNKGRKAHTACFEKPRTITAKFASRCRVCRRVIRLGDKCELNSSKPTGLKIRCLHCAELGKDLSITEDVKEEKPFDNDESEESQETHEHDTHDDSEQLHDEVTEEINEANIVPKPIVPAVPQIQNVPMEDAIDYVRNIRIWVDYVQKVRTYCRENIPALKITQRTAIMGAQMIASGRLNAEKLIAMLMCKGCPKEIAQKLTLNCGLPHFVNESLPDVDKRISGQHYAFGELMFNAKNNIHTYLYGEAGSGKSYSAKVLASMLDVDYTFIAFTPQSPVSQFSGYMDGFGKFVQSNVYHWVINGGVLCMDECDNAFNPSLIWFNNGLASGEFIFPNNPQPVKMHPTCVVIACGNTPGLGPTPEYMDRRPIDESVRSRFAFLHWDTDGKLEMQIALNVLEDKQ